MGLEEIGVGGAVRVAEAAAVVVDAVAGVVGPALAEDRPHRVGGVIAAGDEATTNGDSR